MSHPQPHIGISVAGDDHPAWHLFSAAVRQAGGDPVKLTPLNFDPCNPLPIQGLLLTGGGDILPSFYTEETRCAPRLLDEPRDVFEIALCKEALKTHLPTLGICRGLQVMVVAAGGALFQDLPADMKSALVHDKAADGSDLGHLVSICNNSRLGAIIGSGPCFVNTSHHQAPRTLGDSLVASAVCADGVVEAVEDPVAPFFIGVEWHPERMWDSRPEQFRLIESLVQAACEFKLA